MKRVLVLLAAVLTTIACAAGVAKSGTFSDLSPSFSGINTAAPRYTTEEERLVSEIAGSILNMAAFADHFEPGDPFQVRNVRLGHGRAKYSLARRAEVFTVEVPGHVWVPASYVRLARSFMADAADPAVTEDPARDRTPLATLIGDGIAAQNLRLSRLLTEHPRSSALHERAALLLAAAARQAAVSDRRVLLCRMTAHLAVARALHSGSLETDGVLAEHQLAALAALAAAEAAITGPAVARSGEGGGPVTFSGTPQLRVLPASMAAAEQR
jgi:hypothetical protein